MRIKPLLKLGAAAAGVYTVFTALWDDSGPLARVGVRPGVRLDQRVSNLRAGQGFVRDDEVRDSTER